MEKNKSGMSWLTGKSVPPALEVAMHMCIFLGLNVVLNYVSKLYFSPRGSHTILGNGLGYEFPLFDSLSDGVLCSILMLLIMVILPSYRQISLPQLWEYKFTLLSLMILHVFSIVLNNYSLVWLGLSINQIIKGASPFPSMIFSYLLLGTTYKFLVVLVVVTLTAGCVASVPPEELDSSAGGIVAAIIAMLALALKQVIYQLLLANSTLSGLTPFAITFWQFSLSVPLLLIFWVADVNDEREEVIDYWRHHTGTATWIAIVSAVLSLSYTMSTLSLVKVTSALTLNIVASIKFVLVILIPGVIEKVFVLYNWFGLGVYFVSLCLYTYLKVPREVETYEEALRLDEEEGDRFCLQPGGRFILKAPWRWFDQPKTAASATALKSVDESGRLWGHHIAEEEAQVSPNRGCADILCCSGSIWRGKDAKYGSTVT